MSLVRAAKYQAKYVDMTYENNKMAKTWVHYKGAKNAKLKMLESIDKHSDVEVKTFKKCQDNFKSVVGYEHPLVVGSADMYFIPERLMRKASILASIYGKVSHCKLHTSLLLLLSDL